MIKEIRTIDDKKGIVRITTISERFYAKPAINASTGLPEYQYYPSSTWVCSYYPKPVELIKWVGNKGNEEAQTIKEEAGIRGGRVHQAIELLEKSGRMPIETLFINSNNGQSSSLTMDELEAVMAFGQWHNEHKPIKLSSEMTVFGDGYAGTLDAIYLIDGEVWIVDYKISASIWTPYRLQISSYSHAQIDYKPLGITKDQWDKRKLGILQLNIKLNKNGYRFTQIKDEYDMFLIAKKIWERENPDSKPKQKDIPLILTLNQGD